MNRLTKDRWVVVNLDEEVYGDPVLLKEGQERREVIARQKERISMKQRRARVNLQVQKRIANVDKTIEQLNAKEKLLDDPSTEMTEELMDALLDASAEVTDDQERDQPSSTIRDLKG